MIAACLKARVDNAAALTSILCWETAGNPLYLRTMLANLVNEKVLYFDFEVLVWRFDPLKLQGQLSDVGVDAYIMKLLIGLPADVKETLMVSWLGLVELTEGTLYAASVRLSNWPFRRHASQNSSGN
jgi:hypothetical protein